MGRNLEEELVIPSPIKTIEDASFKNPLFQQALEEIKNPIERKAFLGMFRNYLTNAYERDPKIKRLMKTHDLTERVENSPELENYDERSVLDEQLYSEPGRNYQYANNFLGQERKKKGLLKRLYYTTKDFTSELLPGIVGLGGLYATKKWYNSRLIQEAAEASIATTAGKAAIGGAIGAVKNLGWTDYFLPWNIPSKIISAGTGAATAEVAAEVAGDSLLTLVGSALTPAKYLLGGYFLYKTIRYFMKKYQENKKLKELNKTVWLQNQLLAQRI